MGAFAIALTLTSAAGVAAQSGPDLSIKITGPSHLRTGATGVYDLQLTNVGSETATGIAFSGGVGDQFNPVSLECPAGWYLDGAECAGTLGAGASVTMIFTVKVCCLFKGEVRRASVMAMYFSSAFVDPTPADDWVSKPVYITGAWQR